MLPQWAIMNNVAIDKAMQGCSEKSLHFLCLTADSS